MRNQAWIATALLLVALVGFARTASAETYPHDRGRWFLGLGLGGGTAGVKIDDVGSTDREGGIMGSFRAGYLLNPQVALALEGNGWTKSEDGATVTFSATTAGVAIYPGEGWVLRGGLGFGSTTVAAHSGNTTLTSTESGFGLNGGVGYEFRLAKSFALGPQLEGGYSTFDGGSSNWVGLAAELNWYFK